MHVAVQAGGVLQNRTIHHLSELAGCDVLVNCGGLRAGHLFGDQKIMPVR